MKKIMFNDRYGLTDAVLEGKKTMTRRVIKLPDGITPSDMWNPVKDIDVRGKVYFTFDFINCEQRDISPQYQIGEEVAIAQKYWDLRNCDAFYEALEKADPTFPLECIQDEKGCHNKMFVKAAWMPHRIRINNIKVERLQDISEEDCLREGIQEYFDGWCVHGIGMTIPKGKMPPIAQTADGKPYYSDRYRDFKFNSPREAFAVLIDRISGRGTWDRNPWVFAYEFKLLQ